MNQVEAFHVAKANMSKDGETAPEADPNICREINSQPQWNATFDAGGTKESLRFREFTN